MTIGILEIPYRPKEGRVDVVVAFEQHDYENGVERKR
jgi:hypothetical protein